MPIPGPVHAHIDFRERGRGDPGDLPFAPAVAGGAESKTDLAENYYGPCPRIIVSLLARCPRCGYGGLIPNRTRN